MMSNFESAIQDLSKQFLALAQRIDVILETMVRSQGLVVDKSTNGQGEDDQLTAVVGDLDEAINTVVARFAAVVSVQEAHESAVEVRNSEAYQAAYKSLSTLAEQFSLLLAAIQSRQQDAAKSADTARKRHNAAQRYLDSSGYH